MSATPTTADKQMFTPTVQATSPTTTSSTSSNDQKSQQLTTTKLDWSDQTEELIASWTDVSACYKWLHNQAFRKYDNINFGFNIPISIFSTITGVVSVSMTSIVPEPYVDLAQKVVGGVNVLTGILTYFQTYLKFAQQAEAHRHASVGWAKLERNMRIELKYKRENRKDADTFIKVCRSEYDRLVEQSPDIPTDVIQQFKKKFGKHDALIKPDICDNLLHAEVTKPEEEPLIEPVFVSKPNFDQEHVLTQIKDILAESRLVPIGLKDNEIGPKTAISLGSNYSPYVPTVRSSVELPDTFFLNKPKKSFLGSPPPKKSIDDLPASRPSVKDLIQSFDRDRKLTFSAPHEAKNASSSTGANNGNSPIFKPTLSNNFDTAVKSVNSSSVSFTPLEVIVEAPTPVTPLEERSMTPPTQVAPINTNTPPQSSPTTPVL